MLLVMLAQSLHEALAQRRERRLPAYADSDLAGVFPAPFDGDNDFRVSLPLALSTTPATRRFGEISRAASAAACCTSVTFRFAVIIKDRSRGM